jgi:hypothetical protein
MRYTTLGLPLPDAGDCAACVFGNDHNPGCVGVDFNGERLYHSGMPSVIDQSRDLIRGMIR